MLASTVRRDADEAIRLADQNPSQALPVAQAAARRAHREGDVAAAAMAERALGHALIYCGDIAGAIRHLRKAVSCAEQADSPRLAGEAQVKLAYALAQRGHPRRALSEIDSAITRLDGVAGARARGQRGSILHELGLLDEALSEFHEALAVQRAEQDLLGIQRMLINRALVYIELESLAAAQADLLEAEGLARQLGRELAIGLIAENLGVLERLRGDVPAALAQLDRAERVIAAQGGHLGTVQRDRAELLLTVGLSAEARAAADKAQASHRRERRELKLPELQLLQAQAAFLEGNWTAAIQHARHAAQGFSRQQRPDWAALARLEGLRAHLASGTAPRAGLAGVIALADRLAAVGWPAAALEARIVAGRLAALRGRPAIAREHLRQAARAARQHGTATLRARGWYAQALLRLQDSNPRGAVTAARAGLRIMDEHSAALDASDLRAHAATHRMELVRLGLQVAMDSGQPARVLEWAERGRARQLLHRPVRPPDDPELAGLLAQVRAVAMQLDQQRDQRPTRLIQRQAALERQIRDHRRLRRGEPGAPPPAPVSAARLGAALGEWALVEFVQLDGELHALTMVDERLRMRRLGPAAGVAALTERLPFALHRLARSHARPSTLAAATALLNAAAAQLDSMLLRALPGVGDRPLVVVPTGALHSVPWSVLPSCAGRPVTVSPSATLWYETSTRRPDTGGTGGNTGTVVAAAGPGLAGARDEAMRVAAIHGTEPLLDQAATVDAVLSALSGASLAHLATHGRLSADNPLFSDLLLADGPLVVYDLERLAKVPHTVVLAACDSGRSKVCQGDELLGLGAMFLARGSAQLVASVVPVPDAETTPLMVAFHQRLAAGNSPAVALASAQHHLPTDNPAHRAAAAGFVCIGAGPLRN